MSIISSQQTGVAHSETPRDRVAASERELQPRAGAEPAVGAPFDLHILQVLPALESGGVERGTLDVAAAIVKAGGRATVVSAGGPMVRELERSGARHMEMPVDSKNPWAMWRNVSPLAALVREQRVDLVHARSRAPAWTARAAARRARVPFLTTFHGTYNFTNLFKKKYNSIMTAGERVIAISEFIARHIEETYAVPRVRIDVIHRGVDFDVFSPQAVPAPRILSLAQLWRLPDGVPVVMLPGRLTRWKGQIVFLKALAKLKDIEFMGVIVGGEQDRADYRNELEETILQLGLGSRVRIVGDVRDMAAAFMLADVVVSASTDPEAFGRIIVEAQAMGRPVIATNHGAAAETVLPGVTGWLVPPGDAEALAQAVRASLGLGSENRQRIAEQAIFHARKNFYKAAMCARTLSVYMAVAAERRLKWNPER